MSSQGGVVADEILDLVEALSEHLDWQDACGADGLPRAREMREPRSAAASQPFVEQAPEAGAVSAPEPVEIARPRLHAVPSDAPAPVDPAAALPDRTRSPVLPPLPAAVTLSEAERTQRLATLAQEVTSCTRCGLHQQRKNAVFGLGRPGVDIMVVGEGPGADEDEQGVPFVGKAGQLLDKMLGAMGYARADVYIGNVVKCRPPGNRNPEPEEMSACMPYLHEQIELVAPRVILAMGSTAVRALLGAAGIMRVRGKWKLYRARIPVMPTFHPAYLLRNEAAKRDAWTDLKAVMSALGREVPTKTSR